ncbi:hypothetical protein BDZ45DRAFT_44562 [Acephala macrosclerotiorum]|nr:hypothetical protein BDZ45DRAFT_44562 [Acephala macrosclerotiorum]
MDCPESAPITYTSELVCKIEKKTVAKDHSRIEWRCACGHDLFADFNTKSLDTPNKYAAILKHTPHRNSQRTASQPSTNTLTPLPTAHVQHTNSPNVLRQTAHGLSNLAPICTLQTPSVTVNNVVQGELCSLGFEWNSGGAVEIP